RLSDQTGFPSILRNFDATVENKGYEWQVHGLLIQKEQIQWDLTLNLTIERNKLLDFPGLESSSYATIYEIGEPLNIRKLYEVEGIDPETGLYRVDGATTDDRTHILDLTSSYYGVVTNNLRYKQFDHPVLFQFVKQKGYHYLYPLYMTLP